MKPIFWVERRHLLKWVDHLGQSVMKRPAKSVKKKEKTANESQGSPEKTPRLLRLKALEWESDEDDKETDASAKKPATSLPFRSKNNRKGESVSKIRAKVVPKENPKPVTPKKSQKPKPRVKAKGQIVEPKAKAKAKVCAGKSQAKLVSDELHNGWNAKKFLRSTSGTPFWKFISPDGSIYWTLAGATKAGFKRDA